MNRRSTMVLLVLLLAAGCQSDRPRMIFPEHAAGDCEATRDSARAKIEAQGLDLRTRKSAKVTLHPGTFYVGGEWAWTDQWGRGVRGLYWPDRNPRELEVACDAAFQNYSTRGLEHEWFHYWLETNHGILTHDPRFRDDTVDWIDVLSSDGWELRKTASGERVLVDWAE